MRDLLRKWKRKISLEVDMDNWTLLVRVQEIWECWSAACEDKRQRGVEFNPSGIQQGLLLGFCFKPISIKKRKY